MVGTQGEVSARAGSRLLALKPYLRCGCGTNLDATLRLIDPMSPSRGIASFEHAASTQAGVLNRSPSFWAQYDPAYKIPGRMGRSSAPCPNSRQR